MIEKPQSKKAKSFNRFSGTQDHGDAGMRKGHDGLGYWEKKYDSRGTVARNNLIDYSGMTDKQLSDEWLEDEADRILDEAEKLEEDIEAMHEHEFTQNRSWLPGDEASEHIKDLTEQYKSIYLRVLEMKDAYAANPTDERLAEDIKHMEQSGEDLEDEIADAMRSMDAKPTITEAGGRTDKEIRNSLARAATLDDYSHDDFGDYNGSSHIRISNSHPYDKRK